MPALGNFWANTSNPFGRTDREKLKEISTDGQIKILQLERLAEQDIIRILLQRYQIPDPQLFIQKARQHGLDELLFNLTTLKLLTEAVRDDGDWPETRAETFQMACEKLAFEDNQNIRDLNRYRQNQLKTSDILASAGHLCAVILLSGKEGVCLDVAYQNNDFPFYAGFDLPNPEYALQALRSRLFRQDGTEQQLIPEHRVIAEYLSAQWIANQLDNSRLSLDRTLNVLLSEDRGVVSGLRGLYGWLVSLINNVTARNRLIETDPRAIILYGDPKHLPVEDKRCIFNALKREIADYAAIRYEGMQPASAWRRPYGALADYGLQQDFQTVLSSSERDQTAQYYVDCVLDILEFGDNLKELTESVLEVVYDPTYNFGSRIKALRVWQRLVENPGAQLKVLDDLKEGRINDHDNRLVGYLLSSLYPAHLTAKDILEYLHPTKNNTIGAYHWFWTEELPKLAAPEEWIILLDGLVERPEITAKYFEDYDIREIVDSFLDHALMLPDELLTDERLWSWLSLGIDEYGSSRQYNSIKNKISIWLENHPERYKALLGKCYSQCEFSENFERCVWINQAKLRRAHPPSDIVKWHLSQAGRTNNDKLIKAHLRIAADSWLSDPSASGLSIDSLKDWKINHPTLALIFDAFISNTQSSVFENQIEMAEFEENLQLKNAQARAKRTNDWAPFIPAVRNGTAEPHVMHQIASVWMNHFSDIRDDDLGKRFNNFVINGDEMLEAAEQGFRACLQRADVPAKIEIIALNIAGKRPFLQLPCLIGVSLVWQDDSASIDQLSTALLEKLIAFRLTYLYDKDPEWFLRLIQTRTELVAQVIIDYVGSSLKNDNEHIFFLYDLANTDDYKNLANIAVPELLDSFPIRARTHQMRHFNFLLKSALRNARDRLPALFEKKLAAKNMDIGQRTLWYLVAMLVDPRRYEDGLWNFVEKGDAQHRCSQIVNFLTEDGSPHTVFDLSIRSLSKLIQITAPSAIFGWPTQGGEVTEFMQMGDKIIFWVQRLGAMGTEDARDEVNRLLKIPSLQKLIQPLKEARHQLEVMLREKKFKFQKPQEIAQVLANSVPTNVKDLTALTLDALDDISFAINGDNSDEFRAFWNVDGRMNAISPPRPENDCRDVLLRSLRVHLQSAGIACEPEGDYHNDKRADIKISYGTTMAIPIEIKKSDYRNTGISLARKLKTQLIQQYAIDPGAAGHGIFLVLWLGTTYPWGKSYSCNVGDGGMNPTSAEELKHRLEATIDSHDRGRIFVRVLDVSWKS